MSTEREDLTPVDGEWFWVQYESFGQVHEAPARYKADVNCWYSLEFSGIPAREVKVIANVSGMVRSSRPTSPDPKFLLICDRVAEVLEREAQDHESAGADSSSAELSCLSHQVRQMMSDMLTTERLARQTQDLKDHRIAQLVNELRDVAVKYAGAQQLREQIAHVIVPVLKSCLRTGAESDELRELRKWLNEDSSTPINRKALACVVAQALYPVRQPPSAR